MKNNYEVKLLGGIGEKNCNNNSQYHEQNRIYDDKIATCTTTNASHHPYYCSNMRIRKLTPTTCMKLMGFTPQDVANMRKAGLSDMQIYHCAGDSIVTTVLMGIFAEYLGIDDYQDRIENYIEMEILDNE